MGVSIGPLKVIVNGIALTSANGVKIIYNGHASKEGFPIFAIMKKVCSALAVILSLIANGRMSVAEHGITKTADILRNGANEIARYCGNIINGTIVRTAPLGKFSTK